MKKIVSVLALCAAAAPAVAAPSHITRDSRGGYDVTYDYKDKAKTGWYLTGRAELGFLNWKNKYSVPDWVIEDDSGAEDSYSFEPVFGGSLSAGKRFSYFWRAELEGGYIGYFSDSDDGWDFSLSVPYLTANVYYDFNGGLYLGAGIGAALVTTRLDGAFIDSGNRTKNSLGGMGALMLGYAKKLDDNLVLDIRYRFAGITGSEQSRESVKTVGEPGSQEDRKFDFKNKIDFIMDNSISIGIRYEF